MPWSLRGTEGGHRGLIPDRHQTYGRAALGVFQSTPLGIAAGASGLTAARANSDFRQARFTQRLLIKPQGQGGSEEIMRRQGSALTERLQMATQPRSGDWVERQEWGDLKIFLGGTVGRMSRGPF